MLLEGDHESVDFCPHLYFSGCLIENVDGPGLDVLILVIEADDFRRWLWLETVQPVEELHKHFQGSLLAGLPATPHNRAKPGFVTERNGVVEEKHRTVFERLRGHVLREVPKEGTTNMSKNEGNVINQRFGEKSRQGGERAAHLDGCARGAAVDEDKYGANRADVLLNACYNVLCVGIIFLNTAIAGQWQPRRVEDTNLRKRLCLFTAFKPMELTSMPLTLPNS